MIVIFRYTERRLFSLFQSSDVDQQEPYKRQKKAVTDFRHLHVQIAKNNLAYPLLKNTFSVLGSSKCEVLSVLDLKDSFHSLRLSEHSKKFCRILSYFGSASYLYQRMPMGLNISPSKSSHVAKLEDLLKKLLKNGLKISTKKCQLFRTTLQYMGNEIFIKDRRVYVKP